MISTKYPNRYTLYAAYTVYRDAMRPFIIRGLKKHPSKTPKELCIEALRSPKDDQDSPVVVKLRNGSDARDIIDIDNFPYLIRTFWHLYEEFNGERLVWNETELIKDGRCHWAHPGTKDADPEEVRALLHLIVKVLDKINEPDAKREVEAIRNQLFPCGSKEHLETPLNQLETLEAEQTVLNDPRVVTEEWLEVAATQKTAAEVHRVDLKDITRDPGENFEKKHPIHSTVRGTVTHIADHAVFLKLEEGITGRIHKSDLSWGNSDVVPSRHVNEGEEIEAVVIGHPKADEWIPLSTKSLQGDPWPSLDQRYPIGSEITGPVRSVIGSGVFVEIEPGFNGFLPTSALELLRIDEKVTATISEINSVGRKISLSRSVGTDSKGQIR